MTAIEGSSYESLFGGRMIQEKLYRISLGTAVFGIVTQRYGDIVIAAAPIANWTKGKKVVNVLRYYANKGAEITLLSVNGRQVSW